MTNVMSDTADLTAVIEWIQDTEAKLGPNEKNWAYDGPGVPEVVRGLMRNQATLAAYLAQHLSGEPEQPNALRTFAGTERS